MHARPLALIVAASLLASPAAAEVNEAARGMEPKLGISN